jgi:hypothetical protein
MLSLAVSIFFSCSQNKVDEGVVVDGTVKSNLKVLGKSKIYFGHQSVGYNILNGIQDLLNEANNKNVNIIELKEDQKLPKCYFLHSQVGNNKEPDKKCDDFLNVLNKAFIKDLDIAFLKFCYVDVQGQSDVQAIFNYYKTTIESIQKKFPNLKLVHITIPLSTLQTGWKAVLKRLIGREVGGFTANIKRYQFNKMLKEHYKNESIFDIAKIESSHPDGSRESFKQSGQIYYALIPEYTNDGGHLNKIGRRLAAIELIQVLSKVINMEVKNG